MTYHYLPTFLRLLSDLPPIEKAKAQRAVERLIDFFETNLQPQGLGLKKLRKNFWEIRVDLALRILFEYRGPEVPFVAIGNHNDIQRALKKV